MLAKMMRRTDALTLSLAAGLGVAAGYLIGYFFDPQLGRSRRIKTKDRAGGAFRRAGRRLNRLERYTASEIAGIRERITHMGPEAVPPNEPALVNKVESHLYRDPRVPKGRININAEGSKIFVRGELDTPSQINHILKRVHEVAGVEEVENFMHLKHTEAPNKSEVRQIGGGR